MSCCSSRLTKQITQAKIDINKLKTLLVKELGKTFSPKPARAPDSDPVCSLSRRLLGAWIHSPRWRRGSQIKGWTEITLPDEINVSVSSLDGWSFRVWLNHTKVTTSQQVLHSSHCIAILRFPRKFSLVFQGVPTSRELGASGQHHSHGQEPPRLQRPPGTGHTGASALSHLPVSFKTVLDTGALCKKATKKSQISPGFVHFLVSQHFLTGTAKAACQNMAFPGVPSAPHPWATPQERTHRKRQYY